MICYFCLKKITSIKPNTIVQIPDLGRGLQSQVPRNHFCYRIGNLFHSHVGIPIRNGGCSPLAVLACGLLAFCWCVMVVIVTVLGSERCAVVFLVLSV